MTHFKKSFVKPFARPNDTYTVEDSYWKKLTVCLNCLNTYIFCFIELNIFFQNPVLVKEFGPIDYINFSQRAPYHFAISCSARVSI